VNDPIVSIKNNRILFSPLNWGWGHVTRSIPLLHRLRDQQNEVVICCDEQQENFYRSEFPDAWYIPHAGYPFRFSGNGHWERDIVKTFNALNKARKKEHIIVEDLVKKLNAHLVISDQRYGFYAKSVRSVIISHQLRLPVAKKWSVAQRMNRSLLNEFNEIWIPDNPTHDLSGALSATRWGRKYFIGPQSRLEPSLSHNKPKPYTYLGIVSGPSPYAEHFFEDLIDFTSKQNMPAVIVVPTSIQNVCIARHPQVSIAVQPTVKRLDELFNQSETVISRAGYSTLMDLNAKGKKAILVPTPGQAEQLYLAELHKKKKNWLFVNDLKELFKEIK
jgi:UDP-N-acetylglucosamine:LPS N-acetylglucosamine transferase